MLKKFFQKKPNVDLGDFSLLDKPMSDLVPRKRRIRGMGEPLGGNPEEQMPEMVFYDTDGKVLVLTDLDYRDLYYFARFLGGACLIIASLCAVFLILSTMAGIFEEFEKALSQGVIALYVMGILTFYGANYITKTGFIIFDREHGTVMLPKKTNGRRWVLPFNDFKCYAFYRILPYGGSRNIETWLYAMSKPKGERDFRQQITLGMFTTRGLAGTHWQLIENFMDKSRPIPDVYPLHGRIRWFKNRNMSMAEYYRHPRPHDDYLNTIDPPEDVVKESTRS